ncbi:tetratricopeptide repeat protein [archaeon]|nr:tetratricopeptide repeat protein [Candidatus Woesearchaeota archaeon]MBT4351465.1 tetratricopeptide repeat protein [archaeon]MBT4647544.1 tetratricopeptide repeat protein [archaeon]MBT6821960.1 tetratricopeptide repeat protein [archaeon]MBT7392355.1 tetratricopeptide repeat protein [archaeon]
MDEKKKKYKKQLRHYVKTNLEKGAEIHIIKKKLEQSNIHPSILKEIINEFKIKNKKKSIFLINKNIYFFIIIFFIILISTILLIANKKDTTNNLIETKEEKIAKNLFNSSRENYRKGEFNEAIEKLKKSIEIHPNAKSYMELGWIHFEYNNLNEAENSFKEAIKYNSNEINAYIGLSSIYVLNGDEIKSKEFIEKTLNIENTEHWTLSPIGRSFIIKGNLKEAEKIFNLDIKHNSNLSEPYINMGNLYYKQGEKNNAEKMYNKSINIDNTQASAYFGLGLIQYDNNNYDKAKMYFEKSIEYQSHFFNYKLDITLAKIYLIENNSNKAIELLQNVITNIESAIWNPSPEDKLLYDEAKKILSGIK